MRSKVRASSSREGNKSFTELETTSGHVDILNANNPAGT